MPEIRSEQSELGIVTGRPRSSSDSSLDPGTPLLPTSFATTLDAPGFRTREVKMRTAKLKRWNWYTREHRWASFMCDDGHSYSVPLDCGHRYCDICARSQVATRRRALELEIERAKELETRSVRVKMMTLTMKSMEDPRQMWDHLYDSFDRLQETVTWRKGKVRWWIARAEVTTKGKEWHVHLHVLMLSRFIDQKALSNSWIRSTRRTGMIVHIEQIFGREIGDAAMEVAKYLCKPGDVAKWSRRQKAQFAEAVRDRKLWLGGGELDPRLPDGPQKRGRGCPTCGSHVEFVHMSVTTAENYYRARLKNWTVN